MTYLEIAQMVQGIGLPFTYFDFPDDTEEAPPYICYYYDYNDYKADNENYVTRNTLYIDFYAANRDFTHEQTIESTLKTNGFSYGKEVVFNESERLWQTRYTTEVLING